jgi:hypothetical protein
MKNSSTVVLSLLMIGFSLVAMPASYASYDHEKSYGDSKDYDQEKSYGDSKDYDQEKSYGDSKDYDQFLDIKNAAIGIKEDVIKKIFIETRDEIPQDGSEGAFGYGVILSDGKVIVTTTHAGVLDSRLQLGDINNPVFHNHFVELTTNANCTGEGMNPGFAVADLTFESPGDVIIDNNKAILKNLPATSDGITPGSEVQAVASFILRPLIDLTVAPPAVTVCVEDVQPVDPNYVNIFEVDEFNYGNHYDNEAPRY